jgi:uncharacterized protein involved in copper resistance
MNRARLTAVAFVSTLALGSLASVAAPSAFADDSAPVPCATQQAQVDRATAKLDSLTAKFAAHPTQKNLKAKKAQVKRLDHATARLATCLAAQAG